MPKAALLTPVGRGALACVAVEGAGARDAVASWLISRRPLSSYAVGALVLGRWGHAEGEEVVVRIAGDDCLELCCHGGVAAPAKLLEGLAAAGCEVEPWQAFLERQYADPLTAAAAMALPQARTLRTASVLLDQLGGALTREVHELLCTLDKGAVAQAAERVLVLLARARVGRHLCAPFTVAAIGLPNAGKSSLVNALLGYQRALVHPEPGTTRDLVAAETAFDGWPVRLVDTAGIRPTSDPIEAAGMDLAREALRKADLCLLVHDASCPWQPAEDRLLAESTSWLVVHTKCDLAAPAECPRGVAVSSVAGTGLAELSHAIVAHLVPEPPPPGAAVPFTDAQVAHLQRALEHIEAGRHAAASAALRAVLEARCGGN